MLKNIVFRCLLGACFLPMTALADGAAFAGRALTPEETLYSNETTIAATLWWQGTEGLKAKEISVLLREIFAHHDTLDNLASRMGCGANLLSDEDLRSTGGAPRDLSGQCYCTSRLDLFEKYIVPSAHRSLGISRDEAFSSWSLKVAGRKAVLTIKPLSDFVLFEVSVDGKKREDTGQPQFCSFNGVFNLLASTLKKRSKFIPLDVAAFLPILRSSKSMDLGLSRLTVRNGILTLR